MKGLYSLQLTPEDEDKIKRTESEIDEWLYREEMMWRQRSRITWLREGDRNTEFFHRRATWRRKKNKITKLRKGDGSWTEREEEIHQEINSFFKELYKKDEQVEPTGLLDLIPQRVDERMNASLTKEVTDEEIGDALFQISPLKAPGPDGFPARFYQRNWLILKEDVARGVKLFFADGVMPEGVNNTVIVLIPKGKNTSSIKDYRPISLCNVLYKVISKILVNRLRPFLDDLISETQSAFIPGRMITDNSLIAFECFHKIQHSKNQRDNHCAYKLDLAKAYDRVDWNFLEGVMGKLGFEQKWIKWVMTCVRSVTFSVRCNESLLEAFLPTRGLRQGDPLSPYLFLFVADGLATLLKKKVDSGGISPLKVAQGSPGISNLLFADVSLLFFKATDEQAIRVKETLVLFQKCTGQLLSESKCSLLFSEVSSEHEREAIKRRLGVESATFESRYLGLPTPEGRIKDEMFQPTMDRFGKRCNDWNERFMSKAAKEVHVKSVAQGLPTFVMGVFKLNQSFCDSYEKIIRDFWWGIKMITGKCIGWRGRI